MFPSIFKRLCQTFYSFVQHEAQIKRGYFSVTVEHFCTSPPPLTPILQVASELPNSSALEFTIGQRNAVKLLHDGFEFTRSVSTSRGTKWLCAKKNVTKCKARLRRNPDKTVTVLKAEHNHPPKDKPINVMKWVTYMGEGIDFEL